MAETNIEELKGADRDILKAKTILAVDASRVGADICETFRDVYLAAAVLRHKNPDSWRSTVHNLRQIKNVTVNFLFLLMIFDFPCFF
jgi:hypothetical protein